MYLKSILEVDAQCRAVCEALDALSPMGVSFALHIKASSPLTSYVTYPESWQSEYTAGAYALRDPLIWWGLSKAGTIRWSELDLPDPFRIFKHAQRAGLTYGVAMSYGPLLGRSIGGMSRSDREFTDAEISEAYGLLEELHDRTTPPHSLTDAQKEALRRVASGQRVTAAAYEIGISESAVKARLNAARTALKSKTIPEAVEKASRLRLI